MMALRVVSEYFTKMTRYQKMQAYIVYMQFICSIACLVQGTFYDTCFVEFDFTYSI